MAIFHLSIQIIGRSSGRSAVACAAYRSADKLRDEEVGKTHNFTYKKGVVYNEVMIPENAPAEYADRATLWNAVQKVEKQKNAQLARELEFALPNELPRELQIKYAREFIQKNFVDKGMAADFAIHKKHKKKAKDDENTENDHVHLMLTTRGFKPNGQWAPKEKKDYARDENGNKIPVIDPETGLQKVRIREGKGEEKLWQRVTVEANDWNSRENAETWRREWAETCNRALEEIGSTERLDHRSYERQGIDKEPTIHEGYAARKIEADGGVSERCEHNRQVKERNRLRDLLKAEKEKIEHAIRAITEQIRAIFSAQYRAQLEAERKAQEEAERRERVAADFGAVFELQDRFVELWEKGERYERAGMKLPLDLKLQATRLEDEFKNACLAIHPDLRTELCEELADRSYYASDWIYEEKLRKVYDAALSTARTTTSPGIGGKNGRRDDFGDR